MKKVFSILLIAVMCLTVPVLAAEEAEDYPETDYVFELENGELYIELPQDFDNWNVINDPASWFAISDGRDLITINPVSDEDPAPEEEVRGEWFEEVCQEYYSAEDGTFVVTGYVTDPAEASAITDSVYSVQIFSYQAETDAEDEQEDVLAYEIEELDIYGSCTETDGVSVWSSPSTDDDLIGTIGYAEAVYVAGLVTEDGVGSGWLCVDYDGVTGYVWGDFLAPQGEEVSDLALEAGAYNDAEGNEGKALFMLFNDGWYTAKLWVQLRNDNEKIIDYYTDSVTIGKRKSITVDLPEGYHIAYVSLLYLDITGWDDPNLSDCYDNLDNPRVAGTYCFSTGTTFRPKFKSHQEFYAP